MFVYLSKNYCLDYKPLINVNCCVVVIWLGGGEGGICFVFALLFVLLISQSCAFTRFLLCSKKLKPESFSFWLHF